MKTTARLFLVAGLVALAARTGAFAAENFDDALKRAAADYAERLRQAGDELNRTRERITSEKAPLLAEMRATEARIAALEREVARLRTGQEQAAATKRQLLRDIDEARKAGAYVGTLAVDGLKTANEGLLPAEGLQIGDRLHALQEKLDAASVAGAGGPAAMDVVDFLLVRTRRALGGSVAPGRALDANTNLAQEGTFAFAGPEVFFQPAGGGAAGIVRMREGSHQPVFYPQPEWAAADSAALFSGRLGRLPADPSGGKALRLQQAAGTFWEHVEKGGKVAYAILVVGLAALLLVLHKFWDIAAMRVDNSGRVAAFLRAVARGAPEEAKAALPGISATTRELFAEGLRNLGEPASVLEERLDAILLGQRLHFERRLPLLAVIATAAPLMGLLGTVVGMVKTFTLITVFGTGSATRLSSGISEVLVATELGLAVAIPALVLHGFLANRVSKNLGVLERQAVEFVAAAGAARADVVAEELA